MKNRLTITCDGYKSLVLKYSGRGIENAPHQVREKLTTHYETCAWCRRMTDEAVHYDHKTKGSERILSN